MALPSRERDTPDRPTKRPRLGVVGVDPVLAIPSDAFRSVSRQTHCVSPFTAATLWQKYLWGNSDRIRPSHFVTLLRYLHTPLPYQQLSLFGNTPPTVQG